MSSSISHDEVLDECSRAFAFLTQEHGFAGPFVEVTAHVFTVYFTKIDVAVECIFEDRDEDLSLRIARLTSGKRPADFRRSADGLVVREYFTRILRNRGIVDWGFSEQESVPGSLPAQAQLKKKVQGYSRMLKVYGGSLLEGSAADFDRFSR